MSDGKPLGLDRGLTIYGDPDLPLHLRRSFARSMGSSAATPARPVIGLAQSASDLRRSWRFTPIACAPGSPRAGGPWSWRGNG